MTIDQLESLLIAVALFVIVGLYYRVHQVTVRISSLTERIWGPAWLTMLFLGLFTCWLGIRDFLSSGTESAEFFSLGIVCFIVSGFFYLFWWTAFDEKTD